MLTRREFLKIAGLLTLWPYDRWPQASKTEAILVNDIHSQLNPTMVNRVVHVDSIESIQRTIRNAQHEGRAICIAGGRHAMGAQQFATNAVLIDTKKLNRVLNFDPEKGTIEVEAGIEWPELIEYLLSVQEGWPRQWGIAQKQTGADRLSIGGALAANIHGRGLRFKPIIQDIESFVLVDADENLRTCNRQENSELFKLVIGGYGLFGMTYSVTLRLVPRQKIERIVEIVEINDLMAAFEKRIADRFLYGDYQFSTDEKSEDFLRKGVFSCYRPVDPETPISANQKVLSDDDWLNLIYLAHSEKGQAFQKYADYYLSTP